MYEELGVPLLASDGGAHLAGIVNEPAMQLLLRVGVELLGILSLRLSEDPARAAFFWLLLEEMKRRRSWTVAHEWAKRL